MLYIPTPYRHLSETGYRFLAKNKALKEGSPDFFRQATTQAIQWAKQALGAPT